MSVLNFKKRGKEQEDSLKKTSREYPKVESSIDWTVLKRPSFSEKSYDLNRQNKYVFFVEKSANKPKVKKAVEVRYGVKVESVNIICKKGKMKRFKSNFNRKAFQKKAIVELKEGHKIDIGQ